MDYPSHFFVNLYKIYSDIDSSYPDVTLHSIEDGTKWKAHRVVLAGASEYFKKCFYWSHGGKSHSRMSHSDEIDIHNGISGETLESILGYIYSGSIAITPQNVNDLLVAANYFMLLDIVRMCTTYILENLELENCLDMLLFVWQFNLPQLLDSVVAMVAELFPRLLTDVKLREQLLSLPLDLTVRLLKSSNLIIRHPETQLLTRPHEREKLVLQYILEYSKSINIAEHGDENPEISGSLGSLLTCVNWSLLKHFTEESFVRHYFSPRFDEGKHVEEVERLLETSSPPPYTTRSFTCSELVPLHPMADRNVLMAEVLAGAGGGNTRSPRQSATATASQHITKLTVIVCVWNGITFVGGLTVCFDQGSDRRKHIGEVEENATEVHEIDLEIDEHIVGVRGRAAWLVDALTFQTSKGRSFGPYGGEEGEEVDSMEEISKYREEGGYHEVVRFDWHDSIVPGPHQRIFLDSILVGFHGRELRLGPERLGITYVSFVFREMLPASLFVIKDDRIYELADTNR